jgi:hypothetical protein
MAVNYEGPKVKKLVEVSDDLYEGQFEIFKAQMAREYGETPNGNKLGGRWVLRIAGRFVDFDQYRSDLAERNGITLVYSPDF